MVINEKVFINKQLSKSNDEIMDVFYTHLSPTIPSVKNLFTTNNEKTRLRTDCHLVILKEMDYKSNLSLLNGLKKAEKSNVGGCVLVSHLFYNEAQTFQQIKHKHPYLQFLFSESYIKQKFPKALVGLDNDNKTSITEALKYMINYDMTRGQVSWVIKQLLNKIATKDRLRVARDINHLITNRTNYSDIERLIDGAKLRLINWAKTDNFGTSKGVTKKSTGYISKKDSSKEIDKTERALLKRALEESRKDEAERDLLNRAHKESLIDQKQAKIKKFNENELKKKAQETTKKYDKEDIEEDSDSEYEAKNTLYE